MARRTRRTSGRSLTRKVRARRSRPVTRAEVDRLRRVCEETHAQVTRNGSELDIQFKRMAQIQAEMEELRRDIRKLL